MVKLSDMIKGDKNTLYFIGNGFDLFHKGVKSKFIHFYSWLNLKDEEHEQFASKMESIFPHSGAHGNWLWTQFEEALGKFNIDQVHTTFAGKEKDGFFDEDYQQRAAEYVHEPFSKISLYLKEWAQQINIESVKPILPLGKESQYLTFNYTLLLENVYKIPQKQIWHVHNCIRDNEPLIAGHNQPFPKYFDEIENINIQKSLENLAHEITKLTKPVDNIINEHKEFFDSLEHITKVIVFGHSLSKIDCPYFKEVIHHVRDNAQWVFTVYDNSAKENCEKVVRYFNDYFNDPKVIGVSQYKNKIIPQNCNYISINELKKQIAYE